jgi:hypothetical protein
MDSLGQERFSMLMTKDLRPAIQARSRCCGKLAQSVNARGMAGCRTAAIRTYARHRALIIAREDAPHGIAADQAVAEIRNVLD